MAVWDSYTYKARGFDTNLVTAIFDHFKVNVLGINLSRDIHLLVAPNDNDCVSPVFSSYLTEAGSTYLN